MTSDELEAAGWTRLDDFHHRSPYDGSVQRTANACVFEQYHRDGIDCSSVEHMFGFVAAVTHDIVQSRIRGNELQ